MHFGHAIIYFASFFVFQHSYNLYTGNKSFFIKTTIFETRFVWRCKQWGYEWSSRLWMIFTVMIIETEFVPRWKQWRHQVWSQLWLCTSQLKLPRPPSPRARVGDSGGMDALLNKIFAQGGGVIDNYWTEEGKVHIWSTKWKDKHWRHTRLTLASY